jgi:hypothetical protein
VLTDTDRAVLDLEAKFWRYQATKEQHIRETLGFTPTRYYQVLNSLTGSVDAWEYAPTVLARVERLRERNRLRRSA